MASTCKLIHENRLTFAVAKLAACLAARLACDLCAPVGPAARLVLAVVVFARKATTPSLSKAKETGALLTPFPFKGKLPAMAKCN